MAASERDERARSDWWRNRLAVLDPSRLVFADECGGSNVFGLAPLRARAPGGERAHGKAPRNRGKNTTLLLASMSAEGMGPCVVAVEGATTARVFEAYDVGRALAPALRAGDGPGQPRGAQGRSSGQGAVRRPAAASSQFLPACSSPDFSPPIEEAYSKLKALL